MGHPDRCQLGQSVSLDRGQSCRNVLFEQPTVGLVEVGDRRYLPTPPGLECVLISGHDDVSGLDGHGNSLLCGWWYARSIATGKREDSSPDHLVRPLQRKLQLQGPGCVLRVSQLWCGACVGRVPEYGDSG